MKEDLKEKPCHTRFDKHQETLLVNFCLYAVYKQLFPYCS